MSLTETGAASAEGARRRKSELDDKLFWIIVNFVLAVALAAILWSPAVIFYVALALVPVLFAAIILITLKPEA
ncbi:hypothetical protein A8950_2846 [Dongia mobilis]|uniref:Uncharacterized protein n=1 Tax=Dongia mobilis TaxID=578943 RepID=A0A4R6WKC1_9PROT|nr:hypothetical protein [Dongia mobilis]TDQ80976.1 hypothetical protein A8950_2846 [Dongia mobilis]